MRSQIITLLGLAAGLLTTLSFLPQVICTLKTRSTRDISLGMFLLLTTGIALWFLYGLLTGDLPIIVSNGVTLILVATILALKIKHK